MVVRVGATVVTGRVVRVRQLDREATPDERFEALVDRGERNSRKVLTDREEDFVRGRMNVGVGEVAEDGRTLLGEPLSVIRQGLTQ